MALNGISTLPTKEERLIAKLELAEQKRLTLNYQRPYADITLLPTQYDGNIVVSNPNIDGLIIGRPWVDVPLDDELDDE
jgi:predicted N-formylglutamate amidohydrolase